MDKHLCVYSPIIERPRLALPDGARVALWIGLNIEHYQLDTPATRLPWASPSASAHIWSKADRVRKLSHCRL